MRPDIAYSYSSNTANTQNPMYLPQYATGLTHDQQQLLIGTGQVEKSSCKSIQTLLLLFQVANYNNLNLQYYSPDQYIGQQYGLDTLK